MKKINQTLSDLENTPDWITFLIQNSNLPGPRANLELAQAAAKIGQADFFETCLFWDAAHAPENTPECFVYFCGVLGLGTLVTQGKHHHLDRLKTFSNDPRWRIREAVAIALQTIGLDNIHLLLTHLSGWINGSDYEKRAVVAGLCEPALLKNEHLQRQIFPILETITEQIKTSPDPKTDAFRALKKGLGYGWSVAVAHHPLEGKACFEQLLTDPNPDIRWIVKENLKKKRLERLDPAWVHKLRQAL